MPVMWTDPEHPNRTTSTALIKLQHNVDAGHLERSEVACVELPSEGASGGAAYQWPPGLDHEVGRFLGTLHCTYRVAVRVEMLGRNSIIEGRRQAQRQIEAVVRPFGTSCWGCFSFTIDESSEQVRRTRIPN